MSLENNLEKLERFSAKIWRKYDKEDPLSQLSFNEYDYLIAIKSAGQIRITDLAAEMDVSNPSASNMAKRLELKGLVEKKVSSTDGRVFYLTLTKQAKEDLSTEVRIYKIIADHLRARLSEEEVQIMNLLLDKSIQF